MRTVSNWNDNWEFIKDEAEVQSVTSMNGSKIALPHTWNAMDGQDGKNDYYRGTCYYKKNFKKPLMGDKDLVYVEFCGANSTADIYVNGVKMAHHDGGYSIFRVNITDALECINEIIIAVNNAPNDRVYPQKADFTFYGGLYRDVNLIVVPTVHFDLDYYGTPGIMVTPVIKSASAYVEIKTYVTGAGESVTLTIEEVGSVTCPIFDRIAQGTIIIDAVHLWNGSEDPFLYSVRADLIVEGRIMDTVRTRFGCRTFSFHPQEGFFLNGRKYPLRGVSRHQDRRGVGNALTKDMHQEDIEMIAELGANTIRLAHYQHDQYFYDLCDEYGMVVWAEIPYITEHLQSGRENTISQMTELVVQNYNHPSIICWGISNEITVSGISDDLIENHVILNDLIHKMDQTRPTTMAHVFMLEIDHPLVRLPDISSYNLYYGWYVGRLEDNDEWFDKFHAKYPNMMIGLSEYGADACPKWQTSAPERSDYTEQYQCVYHEHLIKMIMERPYLWASHCWNMFDFGADGRDEGGENGINQKGLVTIDRKVRKDAFYLYKAYLSKDPFVHVCGSRYINRVENVTEVKVYSNQKSVRLFIDGRLLEEQAGEKIYKFQVKLSGEHEIVAKSGELKDRIMIRHVEISESSYVLNGGNIHNWFDEPGMEVKEGYFSIHDSLGEIRTTKEGEKIISDMMQVAIRARGDVAQNVNPNEAMNQMMNQMSVEAVIKLAGGSITKEMVLEINKELSKIPK